MTKPVEEAEIAFEAGFCYNEVMSNIYFFGCTVVFTTI